MIDNTDTRYKINYYNNIIYREIIKELNFLLDQKSIHDIEEKLCNTDKNNHISN